jgi:hypothetical protein
MVIARTSLLYLLTDEDRRMEAEIKTLGAAFKPPFRVYVWSCTTGVALNDEVVIPNPSLMEALEWFMNIDESAFLVLNDIHVFVKDNPPVIRKLKDTAKKIDSSYKTVFMISPMLEIPPEMSHDVVLLDVPLPNSDEVEKLLYQIVSKERNKDNLLASLTEEVRDQCVKAGTGLSSQQIIQAFRKAIAGKTTISSKELEILFEEKRQIVRKSGLLELVRLDMNFDHLGGFGNFKRWLKQREDIFSKRAREYGLEFPKGVLLMGISGCGKSLCVKAISASGNCRSCGWIWGGCTMVWKGLPRSA